MNPSNPLPPAGAAGSTPTCWRKKPVVIEAMLYRGEQDRHAVREFVIAAIDEVGINGSPHGLNIETLEGWLHVSPGDWIIKGVKGEFYPCKPDIFAATYEAASTVPVSAIARLIATAETHLDASEHSRLSHENSLELLAALKAVNAYTAPAAGDGARKAAERDKELRAWFNALPCTGGDYPGKESWDSLQVILARHCPAPGAGEGALVEAHNQGLEQAAIYHDRKADLHEVEARRMLGAESARYETQAKFNRADAHALRSLKTTNPHPDSGGKA